MPFQNLADIKAQIAANEKGVQELLRLVAQYSWPTVSAYMNHVIANAEAEVRRAIRRLESGAFEYRLDSGEVVKVKVTIDKERESAVVDFEGKRNINTHIERNQKARWLC